MGTKEKYEGFLLIIYTNAMLILMVDVHVPHLCLTLPKVFVRLDSPTLSIAGQRKPV